MSYFLFIKNLNDTSNYLSRIAENQFDLDNLNIIKSDYRIIEDTKENFDKVKYSTHSVIKHVGDTIYYQDNSISFKNSGELKIYILSVSNQIQYFLDANSNHVFFNKWKDYQNQINNLNLDSIVFPLNMSLEQYLKDQGQPSLSPLQVP